MADLYNGIAGSPITYLTSDISANQTTISIDDDSALPDAPNICTIGYGENLETIKYGVKSNGVLQEVVRGIEGTPRAWQAGTEVARFFTAYDHNAIIDDFIAHKAESASKHIHSSGSNDDGEWIKFDDGTVIMQGEVTVTYESNSILSGTWTLPTHKVGMIRVFPSRTSGAGNAAVMRSIPAAPATTGLSSQVRLFSATGEVWDTNYTSTVHLLGIGRWK